MFIPIDDPAFVLHHRILLPDEEFIFHFEKTSFHQIIGFNSISIESYIYAAVLGDKWELPPYNGRMFVGINKTLNQGEDIYTATLGSFTFYLKPNDFERIMAESADLTIHHNGKQGYTISVD